MTQTHATSKHRWRGIIALATEAVTVGSTRIEHIQQQLFERPVQLLETVLGPTARPATASATILHHSIVAASHLAIRAVAHTVDSLAGVLLGGTLHDRTDAADVTDIAEAADAEHPTDAIRAAGTGGATNKR